MISGCRYSDERFEVYFEFPMRCGLADEIDALLCDITSLAKGSLIEDKGMITGLSIPYSGWMELLSAKGLGEKLVIEFERFFKMRQSICKKPIDIESVVNETEELNIQDG